MIEQLQDRQGRRTLIFGIDGGTWEVLDRMIASGLMPCLAYLKESGAWGNLQSVVPVNSAAAWSTILTGQAPEWHGVFDFLTWRTEKNSGSPHSELCRATVNASFLPHPTILDLLGEAGPVLSLRVPMTYPPQKVNGVVVAGLPTPDDESAFTNPLGLANELNPLIERGSSCRSWQLHDHSRDNILDQLEAGLRSLERMSDHLLSNVEFQTCFVVARDVDELQHFFWDVLFPPTDQDEKQVGFVERYLGRIERYFFRLDRYLEKMLDWAGTNARVVIFSDHGFGSLEQVWHVNEWLQQRGFLKPWPDYASSQGEHSLDWKIRLNFALQRRFLKVLKRLGFSGANLESSLSRLKQSSQRDADLGGIDWNATVAYAGNVGEEWLPIYINRQNREPQGIVSDQQYEEVRSDLFGALLSDPELKIKAVYRKEDLFDSAAPFFHQAPDVIVETESGSMQTDFRIGGRQVLEKAMYRKACHRRRGMFLLSGQDVKPGHSEASLADIPATILNWMELPLPDYFSGRPLLEHLPQANAEVATQSPQLSSPDCQVLSSAEESQVRQKLESLGYL
ncbi:MAG: alkaline phosphatase family protein [bacterium]